MTQPATLAPGIRVFCSEVWETNSLLIETSSEAIVVDPAFTDAEIAAIARAVAAREPEQTQILITHGHYDHVCGLDALPAATVYGDQRTAQAIARGEVRAQLVGGAKAWDAHWMCNPRIDRGLDAGQPMVLGDHELPTIDTTGHAQDGIAYLLAGQRVLVAGDYLSPISIPWILGSLSSMIDSYSRLLHAIDEHRPRWVVPGHGPVLTSAKARKIAFADLEYLRALDGAACGAAQAGQPVARAMRTAWKISPPRSATLDFAMCDLRSSNALLALREHDPVNYAEDFR